jgi:hypothetical protein
VSLEKLRCGGRCIVDHNNRFGLPIWNELLQSFLIICVVHVVVVISTFWIKSIGYETSLSSRKKEPIYLKSRNVCMNSEMCVFSAMNLMDCTITSMDDIEMFSFGNRSRQSCSRPVIPRIGCCICCVYLGVICVHNWAPFSPVCFDSTQVFDSGRPEIVYFHDKLSVIKSVLPRTIKMSQHWGMNIYRQRVTKVQNTQGILAECQDSLCTPILRIKLA